MGVSINVTPIAGWYIKENPIKMDDFRGTPILGNHHVSSLQNPFPRSFSEVVSAYRRSR